MLFHSNVLTAAPRNTLDGLVVKLFGDVQRRWLETTFPFTDPSLEAEIFFKGSWLEVSADSCSSRLRFATFPQVLGCGAIRSDILQASSHTQHGAWSECVTVLQATGCGDKCMHRFCLHHKASS
jgi:phenylalanyl-tRNA synthetase alpha subunit